MRVFPADQLLILYRLFTQSLLSPLYTGIFLHIWFVSWSQGGTRFPVFLFQLAVLVCSETGSGVNQGRPKLSSVTEGDLKLLSLSMLAPEDWMAGVSHHTWFSPC